MYRLVAVHTDKTLKNKQILEKKKWLKLKLSIFKEVNLIPIHNSS